MARTDLAQVDPVVALRTTIERLEALQDEIRGEAMRPSGATTPRGEPLYEWTDPEAEARSWALHEQLCELETRVHTTVPTSRLGICVLLRDIAAYLDCLDDGSGKICETADCVRELIPEVMEAGITLRVRGALERLRDRAERVADRSGSDEDTECHYIVSEIDCIFQASSTPRYLSAGHIH